MTLRGWNLLGILMHPRAYLALGGLLLAACGDRDAPLNPGMPGIVVEQLPLGVSLDTVGKDTNGCFFYSQNGAVFVVTDDFGAPICLP
ncbi:hypothetical protein AB3Y40_16365 [Yoonia sp. R2331]|uniref:hypothetical protein n=1 Tax=Yoonia sp. R2331 TaxID=3237238 RepID=UPI0034E5F12A